MRVYDIDYAKLFAGLWPWFIRGATWVDFMFSWINPISYVNSLFTSQVDEVRDTLLYDSRVIYLQKRLWTLYDNSEATYVEKKIIDRNPVLSQISEQRTDFTYQISESLHSYFYQQSEVLNQINYIVHLPTALSTLEDRIRATVMQYRQSGTQFDLAFDL